MYMAYWSMAPIVTGNAFLVKIVLQHWVLPSSKKKTNLIQKQKQKPKLNNIVKPTAVVSHIQDD